MNAFRGAEREVAAGGQLLHEAAQLHHRERTLRRSPEPEKTTKVDQMTQNIVLTAEEPREV